MVSEKDVVDRFEYGNHGKVLNNDDIENLLHANIFLGLQLATGL